MSNFRRKRPKKPKSDKTGGWTHRPEPDPEPDPSKIKPVGKKKKKLWVVMGAPIYFSVSKKNKKQADYVYSRHVTEKQAQQALAVQQKQAKIFGQRFPNSKWANRQYHIKYLGN